MYSLKIPKDFNSKLDVVGCFFQYDEEILLLHRQDHKPQGNTWGIPSGKIENGDMWDAVMNEIEEETGYKSNKDELYFFNTFYVRFPDYDFIYHLFHLPLKEKPEVVVCKNEHKGRIWVTPKKALNMPLIEDLDGCIYEFYGIKR